MIAIIENMIGNIYCDFEMIY